MLKTEALKTLQFEITEATILDGLEVMGLKLAKDMLLQAKIRLSIYQKKADTDHLFKGKLKDNLIIGLLEAEIEGLNEIITILTPTT